MGSPLDGDNSIREKEPKDPRPEVQGEGPIQEMRHELQAPPVVRTVVLVCCVIAVLSLGTCVVVGTLFTPVVQAPDPIVQNAREAFEVKR